MKQIIESIVRLKNHRKDIPQLLFIAPVMPQSTILLREAIINFKEQNSGCKEIDFIIHSPGGLADDAYRIIRTLRQNFETVNIVVPFWAKSAATLLSLGGSNIIMDEFGEFGPLDAQLGKPRDDSPEYERESALNDEHAVNIIQTHYQSMFESMFLQVYEHDSINIAKNELSKQLLDHLSKFFEPILKQVDPYKLGAKRRKLDIAAQYANRILLEYGALKPNDSKIRQLVNYLVDGCPDHGFVIDYSLISLFLPNVHKADFFGNDYAKELTSLSLAFIKDAVGNEGDYIGFIEEGNPNPEEAHKINLEEETFSESDNDDSFTPESSDSGEQTKNETDENKSSTRKKNT